MQIQLSNLSSTVPIMPKSKIETLRYDMLCKKGSIRNIRQFDLRSSIFDIHTVSRVQYRALPYCMVFDIIPNVTGSIQFDILYLCTLYTYVRMYLSLYVRMDIKCPFWTLFSSYFCKYYWKMKKILQNWNKLHTWKETLCF